MLLRGITVYVPSPAVIDADISKYGELSPKCRVQYGEAAVKAGDPDHDMSDSQTSAGDAIANILHWLSNVGGDPVQALRSGMFHFENDPSISELRGE